MGMSPTATIAYGIDFGHESEDEMPDALEDFETYIEKASGLPCYGEDGYIYEVLANYKSKLPVAEVMYGYDYDGKMLAVPDSITSVEWTSKQISIDATKPPEGAEAFKLFCDKHGLKGEMGWFLLAEYS